MTRVQVLHTICCFLLFSFFSYLLLIRLLSCILNEDDNLTFGCPPGGGGGGYSHTLPIRVCAAQPGRDFEAPDLERGIHFRGVF